MTRARKVGIGCLGIVLVLVLAAGGGYYRITRPDERFVHAVSIETDPVYHDPALLERAWSLPVASLYRPRFDSQHNGSFCGPTSVVDVVRSTGGDADQDHVLDGSGIDTVFGILPGGITIEQVAALLTRRFPEAHVAVHRDLDLDALRALLVRSNDPHVRLVANFHRGPLFARGVGHHSPIGGYLEDEDLAFVLDVNHDYQPWLARVPRLLEAMNVIDPATGDTRGVVLVEGID
jgi:hypothetical protein